MSIFESYDNYEDYPKTEYFEGDKKFGEIAVGDTLYCINLDDELVEVKVTNPLHVYDYHWCITYNHNKTINFGTMFCWNVEQAKDKSIADFLDYNGYVMRVGKNNKWVVVGTNKETVIKYRKKYYIDKIIKLEKEVADCRKSLEKLNNC